jgi:RNA polymerase sigma factor (sigma-70 family)
MLTDAAIHLSSPAFPARDGVEAPASGVRLIPTSPTTVELCYGVGMSAQVDPLVALAEAAALGDAAATRSLLEAVGPAVLAVARAVLGRADRDLEDVVQESLVGVVKALPTFRGESSFVHFARSVALRRALDQRRSRARRGAALELELDDEVLAAPEASPDQAALAARRRTVLRQLLGELPAEQAEAFAQRVLFGFSNDEIAAQMSAPLETVRSRLRLAKAALRERIQNDPMLLELLETDDDDAS